jgi:SAM-dependent methyltransferase
MTSYQLPDCRNNRALDPCQGLPPPGRARVDTLVRPEASGARDPEGVNPWRTRRRTTEKRVAERVSFEGADAASLPFDDEAFDLAVSNFVFHEVRGVRDKRRLLNEALRVVKGRGLFVFQDLFLWRLVYGEIGDLLDTVRSWGVESVDFVDTSRSPFIPRALKLPFMLGTAGILCGKK